MDLIEHNGRKIVLHYDCPPIPYRNMDWCAWSDDEGEEAGNYGRGATAEEAVKDLVDQYGD